MYEALNRNRFFVQEDMRLFRAAFDSDILDPETQDVLLVCREQPMEFLTRLCRFSDLKRVTPFHLVVSVPGGPAVFQMRRGAALTRSRVDVMDADGETIGGFVLKGFSVCGAFDVVDALGAPLCELRGERLGWRFRFVSPDGVRLATVQKVWAGLRKELFSSASDYLLEVDDAVPPHSVLRQLILASVLCIGMVAKVEI